MPVPAACGKDPESDRGAAMQPYALELHWSPNCLFKWQVIPSKQITPRKSMRLCCFFATDRGFAYNLARELLGLYGIDLGDCRIK